MYTVDLGTNSRGVIGYTLTVHGCEGCHMRSPAKVDCHRGYEWGLMKEAAARNPEIILYGLPWAWAGWLGFGTNSPYANVTATADYTAKWIECGRDAHSLNISVIGLWNEEPGPIPYILALRKRLDEGGLQHVKIIAPDGGGSGMDEVAVRNRFFCAYFLMKRSCCLETGSGQSRGKFKNDGVSAGVDESQLLRRGGGRRARLSLPGFEGHLARGARRGRARLER
jgi:hypothetical protein